jgi:hypothetical protein
MEHRPMEVAFRMPDQNGEYLRMVRARGVKIDEQNGIQPIWSS